MFLSAVELAVVLRVLFQTMELRSAQVQQAVLMLQWRHILKESLKMQALTAIITVKDTPVETMRTDTAVVIMRTVITAERMAMRVIIAEIMVTARKVSMNQLKTMIFPEEKMLALMTWKKVVAAVAVAEVTTAKAAVAVAEVMAVKAAAAVAAVVVADAIMSLTLTARTLAKLFALITRALSMMVPSLIPLMTGESHLNSYVVQAE